MNELNQLNQILETNRMHRTNRIDKANKRSTPPFLNSLLASATILSYIGETRPVAKILSGLSRSTAQYLEGHASLLNSFCSGPRIPTAITFDSHEPVNLGRNWQEEVMASY